MGVRPWRLVSAILLIVGLLVSGLMLARTFALLSERGAEAWDVCSLAFGGDCDAALLATSSWRLGIPLAGWGLVLYSVLACLLALGHVLREGFEAEALLAALLLSVAAGVASLVLLAAMLFEAAPLCPLCLVIHAVNFSLIPALKRQSRWSFAELWTRLRAGGRYVSGAAASRETTWKAVVFLVPALVAVAAYQWVFVEASLRMSAARTRVTPESMIRAYESQAPREIPIGADDPALGPDDAPVQLVVFSSFPCAGCRQLAQELTDLDEHFRGKLRIVFKHFPLSPVCNAHVAADRQPRACAAATFGEAAHRQGRFWDVHTALFAGKDFGEERFAELSQEVGLHQSQLAQDRSDPRTLEKIRADADLGAYLGVTATPTVYLNGRFVDNLSAGVLDVLIHHLLEDEGHSSRNHHHR